MPKPIDRQEPLIQDTLARLEALGKSDRSIEKEAGVPQGFLKKSRQGKNRHETAAPSWAALRTWLANQGAVGRGVSFEPEALAGAPSPATPGIPTLESLTVEIAGIGTSSKRLREAHQTLAVATILGLFKNLKQAEIALGTLKAMKDAIKLEKFEEATERLGELELMTLDEVEDFRAWQSSRTPKSLEPGESARPPEKKP